MKKHILAACILTVLFVTGLSAQKAHLLLTAPAAELKAAAKDGSMYVIGQVQETPGHTSENTGTWITHSDGSLLWRYVISAPGARGIDVYFTELSLPPHAAMVLRAPDNTFVAGPYFASDISEGVFATGIVPGENALLEVYLPGGNKSGFFARIPESGYIFRGVENLLEKDAGDLGASESCEVNVNCPEGINWQDEKRAVVKIKLREGNLIGLCSGTLLNNTAQDCKNYLLTAQHCGAGATVTNLNQWVFYFNFESPDCSTPGSAVTLDDQTITGCVRRATGGTVSEVANSDFHLLELNKSIPPAYNVYYAGWNKAGTASPSGVSIHHPMGDIKKISTYTSSLISSSWTGTPGTHWAVSWAATASGHGVTEGGSSGSPIFDNNGRVIGDLSGGSSECAAPMQPDLYGKLSYSWESVGTTADRRLKPWLDPAGQNPSFIDGRNACTSAAAPPVADFTVDNIFVPINGIAYFTQLCTNSPTTYSWTVSPAVGWVFAFGNSGSPYPGIRFIAPGCYTITLTASNSAGSDSETKTSYVCASQASNEEENTTAIQIYPNPAAETIYVKQQGNETIEFHITDIQGKTIRSGILNGNSIAVDQLSDGTYYLRIRTGKTQQTVPFVVAH